MKTNRNTVQRSLVLETVTSLHTHPTAEEIYLTIAQKHPSVSRSTVYRNLNLLAEEGAIRKVLVPEGADRYDYRVMPHYHIRCARCGRVFDVDMEYQPQVHRQIRDTHGFTVQGHDIVFQGICPQCK